MKFTSPAAVAAQIVQLEQRLSALRRLERARAGGRASGRVRQKPDRDETIRTIYHLKNGEYGAVKEIALQVGLSVRQVRRILRVGGVKRDTVTDALSRGSYGGKKGRQRSLPEVAALRSVDPRSGTVASRAIKSTGARPAQLDDTAYPATLSLEELLDGAENLIKATYREANDARIPGGTQFNLETVLRLIEGFAGEWHDHLENLRRSLGPKPRRPRNRSPEGLLLYKRTRS